MIYQFTNFPFDPYERDMLSTTTKYKTLFIFPFHFPLQYMQNCKLTMYGYITRIQIHHNLESALSYLWNFFTTK